MALHGYVLQHGKLEPVTNIGAAMGIKIPDSWGTEAEVLAATGWSDKPHERFGDEYEAHIDLYQSAKDTRLLAVLTLGYEFGYAWVLLRHLGEALELLALMRPLMLEGRHKDHAARTYRLIAHRLDHDPDEPCEVCETYTEHADRVRRETRR